VRIVALLVCVFGLAQADPTVRLKTRRIAPAETAAGASRSVRGRNDSAPKHFIVQFARQPSTADVSSIRNRGVRVLGYVPEDALLVSGRPSALEGIELRWIGALEPEDKISPALGFSRGRRPVVVEFHSDVDAGAARRAVLEAGVELREHPDLAPDHLLVRATADEIRAIADADEIASLVMGLTLRGREFVLAVPATVLVQTERGALVRAGQLWEASQRAREESPEAAADWLTPPAMATAMVRLALSQGGGPALQLMTVRPAGGGRRPQLWLSNIRDRRRMYLLAGRLDDSARLLKGLETDFGLADFEGRSYPGWHHYMTLVSAACAWSQVSHTYESV
jgi:nucleotide-binding universal stress UspA family protein